jgi:lipopolysaccharide biosynthesis glycosyltransferase
MILNAAFSFTDFFAQHGGLSILSLMDNNKDIEEINIYVIDNHIGELNKQRLQEIADKFNRRLMFISLEKISSSMKVETNFNRSTYGKLFLSQITEVDRMLVFDSDTIVTGSVKDLLTMNIDDTLFAGVQDTVNPFFVKKIGLTNDEQYINCGGVIVLNLKLWRALNIEQKCVDYVMKFNGNPPFVDQGTINHICKDHKQILPPSYNVINPMFMFPVSKLKRLFKMKTYYSQEEINYAIANPIVIHFTGELYHRPWFSNCTHPLKDVYLKYLALSPWKDNLLTYQKMSGNVRIQNFVYTKMPFLIYLMMIRFIEVRHKLTKRTM